MGNGNTSPQTQDLEEELRQLESKNQRLLKLMRPIALMALQIPKSWKNNRIVFAFNDQEIKAGDMRKILSQVQHAKSMVAPSKIRNGCSICGDSREPDDDGRCAGCGSL